MTETPADDAVRREVRVPLPLKQAFALFAEQFIDWWPGEFTFSESALASITLEPRAGGRWYELSRTGEETVWGEVLVWDAPHRIELTWQISPQRTPEPGPDHGSRIAVQFSSDDGQTTRVQVEHREFERHGDGAEIMRAGMASTEGWSKILDRYAAAAS